MPEEPAPDARQPETAPPPTINPPASQAPIQPPAAAVVLNGTRTEREVNLETELAAERLQRKDREVRISHLEDQNRQLRTVTDQGKPKPSSDWKFPFEED